jgi:predicted transposase YdaD
MRQPYDRSSKWLIQHHGDGILRLGGLRDIQTWRALQAELVQPRQLPDGLLEVHGQGRTEPDYFIVEIATYADERVDEQVVRDALLVYLDRRVLPEVLTLVLRPRGQQRVAETATLDSRHGWTQWQMRWRVVELWTIPAADLLAANDVGLIPWTPLTQFDGPPEPILQQCRERIEQQAPERERANLLAVTQVLTRLRYNDPGLLALLGGSRAMIESPLIQELMDQAKRECLQAAIVGVLEARFAAVPAEIVALLRSVREQSRLEALNRQAAVCPDLEAFRIHLSM